MNNNLYTTDILYENALLRYTKRTLILTVAALLIAAAIIGIGIILAPDLDGLQIYIAMAAIPALISGLSFWLVIIFGFIGMSRKSSIDKYVAEYGEDVLINELNNDAVFVFKNKKDKPITIITSKRIYDVGIRFVSIDDIDMAYGYTYKGSTSIRLVTLKDNYYNVCNNIGLNTVNYNKVFAALYQIKPSMLLGYNSENFKIHREHVKEYKKALKNQ